ncbi:MAG: hypothetical protein ABJC26_13240 [Gemmatimonadaceae bacterium]
MMRRLVSLLILVTSIACGTALEAQTVPIRELSAPSAKSVRHFGTILNVRELPHKQLLVNDGGNRQLFLLDSTLTRAIIVFDSANALGLSYGPRASPLIPYLADSSIFVDGASSSLLVIDPSGKLSHAISAPQTRDLRYLSASASGVDARGNLIYRIATFAPPKPPSKAGDPTVIQQPDSALIVRANFASRTVDTLARVRMNNGSRTEIQRDENGKTLSTKFVINPVVKIDEWAVLSGGSIALVRGQDYHIDWYRTNDQMESTSRLPFDWKRLTDDAKQSLIDSTRRAMEKELNDSREAIVNSATAIPNDGPRQPPPALPAITFVPLSEMSDYYPPIRFGAARADLDNRLWILPTTSSQSKNGELIYDVVNEKGQLTERIRVPVGRSIAGFGHNDVVYLASKNSDGWSLERTKILH